MVSSLMWVRNPTGVIVTYKAKENLRSYNKLLIFYFPFANVGNASELQKNLFFGGEGEYGVSKNRK